MRQSARRLAAACCALAVASQGLAAQSSDQDRRAVARNLVQAGMIRPGDKVLITGSVRDAKLLEDLAIETMKAGGQPLVTLGSEAMLRRSYDEVPASYDTLAPVLGLAIVNAFDAQIIVDIGESEDLLADVPVARKTARAKAGEPVTAAYFARGMRLVNFGNGLYPNPTLARRLGIPEAQLRDVFWQAARVPAATLRARADSLRTAFAGSKQVTLTHPNGTSLTFAVAADSAIVSDGALTAEQVKRGSAAASTWLPAGELILPARAGTAEGKLVVDRVLWDGKEVRGLTLTFAGGRLTAMTATSGLEPLKARYDAASGAKDQFGFLDLGLNPEARLPVGSGYVVWMAPGAVTLGLGDNRGFGGTHASDFGLPLQLAGATVKVDGRTVVENGKPK